MIRTTLRCLLLVSAFVAAPSMAQSITYVHTDLLGSPILESDSTGKVTRQVDYRPYGSEVIDAAKSGTGFTGHYRDAVTGLVYMQQRYYDSGLGMFVSTDPIAADSGTGANWNRYWYANNNPYRFVDPDGRKATVRDGRIWIEPEDKNVPRVNLPNNVGAVGFEDSMFSHVYNIYTFHYDLTLEGVGDALADNPTPGNDGRATGKGTKNNVGSLPFMLFDGGTNMVRSYLIASPDPKKFTDIVVNYTIDAEHSMEEGFVMRYGILNPDSSITLRSYGEGDALPQVHALEAVWDEPLDSIWKQNHNEVAESAAQGQ